MRTPLATASLAAALGVAVSAVAQTAPAPAPVPSVSATAAFPEAAPAQSAAPAPSTVPSTPPAPPASPPSAEHEPLPAASVTPAPMLAVNVPIAPGKDTVAPKAAPAEEPSAWLDGHGLGVEAMFRGGSRIGSTSFTSDSEERAGLGFDLAAWLRLAPEYTFGLAVKRMDLGSLSYTVGQSTINAGYATTALEFGGRAYPIRREDGELFVGLRVGLAWQDVNATGLTPSVNLQPSQPFSCSDSGGPGFALGAELGGALRLTRAFWLTGSLGADGYHLSGDVVGTCVGGIGSITAVSLGGGLLYAFDIGREAKLAAAPRRSAF